jgi:hypothetical protein
VFNDLTLKTISFPLQFLRVERIGFHCHVPYTPLLLFIIIIIIIIIIITNIKNKGNCKNKKIIKIGWNAQ